MSYDYYRMLDSPYKGLMPYSQADIRFFFGRENIQRIVADNLLTSRLTIFYGTSGVGKSSVLQAGVAHQLNQKIKRSLAANLDLTKLCVVVFKAWRERNPLAELANSIHEAVKSTFGIDSFTQEATFRVSLDLKEKEHIKLLIILDQFEDYFLYHPQENGEGTFAVEFARAVNSRDIPANFLISIREESLAKLDCFKGHIPKLFNNYLRLKHLDERSARDAITKPVDEYNRQQIVIDRLTSSPLTVLHGANGVGKSSLLRYGIASRLNQLAVQNLEKSGVPELAVIVFNSWDGDPIAKLKKQVEEDIKKLYESQESTGVEQCMLPDLVPQSYPLDRFLQEWSKHLAGEQQDGKLFIILDQFEQYLQNYCQEDSEDSFALQLKGILHGNGFPVNVLISIRTKTLNNFKEKSLSNSLNSSDYLCFEQLDEKVSKSNQKVSKSNQAIKIEPALIEEVLKQTQTERFRWGEPAQGKLSENDSPSKSQLEMSIETPVLQLVMTRLWQEELKAHSHWLSSKTFDDFDDPKNKLTSAEKIANDYLDVKLNRLSLIRREIAANIFQYLVTPSRAKIAQVDLDLIDYAKQELISDAEIQNEELISKLEDEVKGLLSELSRGSSRILRPVGPPSGQPDRERYEIFHDVLCPAILNWRQNYLQYKLLPAQLELKAKNALEQFKSSQLGALQKALETGQKLREAMIQDEDLFKNTPTVLLALQKILDNIREKNQFRDPDSPILSVSFSSDGQQLATGSANGTVCLWNLKGQKLAVWKAHKGTVYRVAFSRDGQKLATASWDATARVWDLKSQKELAVCEGHTQTVYRVTFSRDGQKLATASWDNTVRLWDLQDLQDKDRPLPIRPEGHPLEGHQDRVMSVIFSPDGQWLATGSSDKTARLWDLQGNKQKRTLSHKQPVLCVRFSPDGKLLATGSWDGTVSLWDWQDEKEVGDIQIKSPVSLIKFLINFAPSQQQLKTVTSDGRYCLWDLEWEDRHLKFNKRCEFKGYEGLISDASISPDAQQLLLATASADGSVHLWGWQDKQMLVELKINSIVYSVSFSIDGQQLITGSEDGKVRLWNLQDNQLKNEFLAHKERVFRAIFSPDGHQVATTSEDRTARLWQLKDGQLQEPKELKGHKGPVYRVIFSHDSKKLATTSEDGKVRLWNLENLEVDRPKKFPVNSPVYGVSFSPDGKKLAATSEDGITRLWNLENLENDQPVIEFKHPSPSPVYSVNFSPDGQKLVTAGGDSTIRIWSVDGERLNEFTIYKGPIWTTSISEKKGWIATASWDGTASVWDLKGSLLAEFKDHEAPIFGIDFSPDGQQLATASSDGTVKIRQIQTLEQLLERSREQLKLDKTSPLKVI